MGFSVTGRVLNGPKGEGVPEAVVTLNNQIKGGQTCWPLRLVFDHRQMKRKQNLNDSVEICQLFGLMYSCEYGGLGSSRLAHLLLVCFVSQSKQKLMAPSVWRT